MTPDAVMPDPERIAALLDGRLDPTQRAALLREIEASPAAFEVYAEVLAVLRETSEREKGVAAVKAVTPPTAIKSKSRRIPKAAAWIALAAVLAFAIVVPARRAREVSLPNRNALLRELTPTPAAVAFVSQGSPWSQRRGSGDALTPLARSIRIGARITDLHVVAGARDSATSRIALELAALLDGTPAGGIASAGYRAIAARGVDASPADIDRAADAAEQVNGVATVRLGEWLEAARLAASRSDSAFFQVMPVSTALAAMSSIDAIPDTVRVLARSVDSGRATAPSDWSATRRMLDEILRNLAGS